jgi:hypothetical protein
MKKVMVLLAVAVLAVAFFGTTACKKPALADPTPTPTIYVLLDDFVDGDNRTDTTVFGGYWYTFDDLSASNDNVTCGDSNIKPQSANAGMKFYGMTTATPAPTFIMQSYTTTSETKPTGVTSGYYARVSGTVDRSGYPYGFVGFGCNLLDVNPDGSKQIVNFTTAGYKRLQFWYKNGPTLGAGVTVPWKVKLPTSVVIGAGPCTMGDVDDQPVKVFTSTNVWQKFDVALDDADFANEAWGVTACGSRAALTTCVPGSVSYIAGGAQYKCTATQALSAMNALQWQTNFSGTSSSYPYDLEIAQVTLIK